MSERIHIVIAESSTIIRLGLVALFGRITSLNIDVAEISDISSITTVSFRQTPDILVVNPSHLGLYSLTQLRGEIGNENLKIVALQSTFSEQSTLQNYDQVISIYDGIETVKEKIENIAFDEKSPDSKKELTVREKEVIVCVVKGMINKQIADELCLSIHTVIAHRRNIANKLQIFSPSGLTIYAIVNKLVDLSDIKHTISQARESE
ncbi:MAG: LuxR C-terminal-related transcriptional regulator [Rikenellaceae bacterium]